MPTPAGGYVLSGGLWQRRGRASRTPGGALLLGPKAVDITPQSGGTVRSATSAATLTSALAASVAGDTVTLSNGSYGAFSTSKSIASGLIRIVPLNAGAVTFGRVDLSGAQGLDFRGINTTDEVYYSSSSRVRWRGGTSTPGATGTGHNVRESCSDLLIEDPTVTNALCSFYFYASTDALASTNITVQRVRSNNVAQDHFFVGRATFLTIQDSEATGHTESTEHQDGVQIVGGKDVTIRRNHFWNTRTFRDAAVDRNDHGIIINYDPAETAPSGPGRKPERITIENNLIHDMTATGIAIAGCLTASIVNNTVYDNGSGGTDNALSVAPDAGNTINGLTVKNNIFSRWSQTGATMTSEANNFVGDASGPAGTARLTGAPGFVAQATADYRLTAGSQNRGSGTATGAAVGDLYQVARPTPPSRGAIE